jgi:RHS repeat-associated protein
VQPSKVGFALRLDHGAMKGAMVRSRELCHRPPRLLRRISGDAESPLVPVRNSPTKTPPQPSDGLRPESWTGLVPFDAPGPDPVLVPAGPVAWWRLNETAGSAAADSSGSGYSATYSGITLNRPAAPSGGTGNTAAAGFSPASGSKVILDDPSLDITDDLTVQAWVKSTDNGNWQMIVTRMNYDGAWRIGYEFRLTPDGRLSFEQSTSAGEVRSVESVGAITRGTWTKVTATRRNGVIAFYIGSTAQTLRTSSNTSSDGNLGRSSRTPNARTLIGARDDGYLFNGDIDEVVVHARALSATEVAAVPAAATYLPAVTYAYDANGNNTRVIDGRSNSWLTTYNTWNLVQDRIEPSTTGQTGILNRRFVTTYDAGGLPVRDELPGISTHVVVDRVFDNIGNMTSEQSVANTDAAAATRTFSYDQIGRTTTMSHPTSTANMAWNDRNQLVAVTGPSSLASSFTYDARGRMTARLDAAGTTSYSWDGSNRLKTEADPLTNSTRTYSWLADNRVSGVVCGAAGSAVSRSYTYDGLGRLASDTTLSPTSVSMRSVTYGYDANGNVVSEAITGSGQAGVGTHSYGYDAGDRLLSWAAPGVAAKSYTWDANGNRLTNGAVAATYDARNRLLSSGSETYSWTPRGTLLSKVVGAVTTVSVFDGLGRMTTANGNVVFTYDALGRPATRAEGVSPSTLFSYSGLDMDATKDGSSGSFNTVAHSPSGDPISLKVGSGAGVVVGRDRHGDVTSLFAPSASSLGDTVDYDPFGVVAGRTGSMANRFGFQGDYTDPSSGLVNMGARWYSPSVSAFTARDTYNGVLKSPVTLNRYTYANANPMAFFDPDGNCAVRIDGDYCVGKPGKNGKATVYKKPPPKKAKPKVERDRSWKGPALRVERERSWKGPAPRVERERSWKGPAPVERERPERLGPASVREKPGERSWHTSGDEEWVYENYLVGKEKTPAMYNSEWSASHNLAVMRGGHGSGEVGRLSQAIDEALPRRTGNEPYTVLDGLGNFITAVSLAAPATRYVMRKVAGGAIANTATGGAATVRVGQAGEAAVRGAYDIGPKATAVVNGAYAHFRRVERCRGDRGEER